jgi:hypothetical protein
MAMTVAEWLYVAAFHAFTLALVVALGYWVYHNDIPDGDLPPNDDGGATPAPLPSPARPSGGLPLPTSAAPSRRLHPGEQLAELHEPPRRREHAPERPPIKAS